MALSYTYDDRAVREDLLDIISNIDPTETQLMTGLGTSKATSALHEWPVDTLAGAGTNAQVEGYDATGGTRTNPTRVTNRTQIVGKDVIVSDTERSVNTAGFSDRFQYELEKMMKEMKNDFEFALVRGSLASGSGSVARQMTGLKVAITTNATSQSGVSLSENILNDYIQNAWDDGGKIDEIYVGMRLKRRISGFTAGNTKEIAADDKRLVNSVNVYEADASPTPIKIFAHRHVTTSGDVHNDIIGIQSDLYKVAWLREPHYKPLGATGDNTKGLLVGEGTLEYRAEKSSFIGQRHL